MDLTFAVTQAGSPPPVLAPAEVVAYALADVTIIIVAARLVGTLFEWIRQPRIVGEIVAGILIGPTILGGTLDTPASPTGPAMSGSGVTHELFPLGAFSFLNLTGQIALVFYMFLVGLELDKRLLRGKTVQMVTVAFAVSLVPVGLGFVAGGILDDAKWHPPGVDLTTFSLFLGAGLAVTAFPVMARILQEKGALASPMGAVGIGAAAMVTVLMFLTIVAATASQKGPKGSGIVGETGTKVLLFAGLVLGLFLLGRPLMRFLLRGYREGEPLGGNTLALLLAGALATGLATDRILGVGLVGGFLFGLAVPALPGLAAAAIQRMESAVILFLLPIFLAVSGLRTDLTVLEGSMVGGLLLFLALMVVGKWGVGFLAGRAVGLRTREANAIGVLLNCRGLLILVVGLIGLQLKVITPAMQVVFVIGAIVTTMMTGPLVDLFLPKEEVRRQTQDLSVEELEEGQRRASGTAVIAG